MNNNDLSYGDLEEIVRRSKLASREIPEHLYSQFSVVNYNQKHYKVRKYREKWRTDDEISIIRRAPHLFAPYHGRIANYLVYDFVEDTRSEKPASQAQEIGTFLVELASVSANPISAKEFDHWCDELQEARFFRPRTADLIREYFTRRCPEVSHWNAEYIDAVPKNFAVDERGRFVSIDAKHLHIGPRGLGLVKLHHQRNRLISEEEYQKTRDCFCSRLDFHQFSDPDYLNFVSFFYCMVGLLENARFISPCISFNAARNQWRRQIILDAIQAPSSMRWIEAIAWKIPHEISKARLFTRRAVNYSKRLASAHSLLALGLPNELFGL